MAASGFDAAFVRQLIATLPNGSRVAPYSWMYRLAHAAYAAACVTFSGHPPRAPPPPPAPTSDRRNGSFAALRDAQGSRSIDEQTSATSHAPENTALTASTIENMTTGAGREKWVTSVIPSAAASACGPGAPGSPIATTPSTSAPVRPASRMACVDASSASASDDRWFVREKPVLPTPTIATWSLTGLRAIAGQAPLAGSKAGNGTPSRSIHASWTGMPMATVAGSQCTTVLVTRSAGCSSSSTTATGCGDAA